MPPEQLSKVEYFIKNFTKGPMSEQPNISLLRGGNIVVECERYIELEIDEKTLNETTQCHRNFTYLTDNDKACCEVEKCLARNILLMKNLDKEYCNYRMFAGNSYVVCDCPIRKEIYKKYNV